MAATGSHPLVTVITPVYNGAQTLADCIESVLTQTYTNWEYLVVENRSTDASREIAERYAARDTRIRVLANPKFVSAMENHLIGFRHMSSESRYCKVVQADDWIFPECIERMVAVAEAHPSVAMVSSYRLDEEWVTLDGLSYPSTVLPGREICRRTLLDDLYVWGTPTSLLLRSDVIRARDPFYDEAEFPHHWDTAVCYEILRDHDFGFVHQVLTFTRREKAARTAESDLIGSMPPEHLLMLKRYGRWYLQAEEYRRRLEQRTRGYYRFLGARAFRRPGRAFWEYHRRALRKLDLPSSRLRLMRAAAGAAAGVLTSPARTLLRTLKGSDS